MRVADRLRFGRVLEKCVNGGLLEARGSMTRVELGRRDAVVSRMAQRPLTQLVVKWEGVKSSATRRYQTLPVDGMSPSAKAGAREEERLWRELHGGSQGRGTYLGWGLLPVRGRRLLVALSRAWKRKEKKTDRDRWGRKEWNQSTLECRKQVNDFAVFSNVLHLV